MILEFLVSALATIAFAVLFGVPRRYYLHCGLVGMVSWATYRILGVYVGLGEATSILAATIGITLLSRLLAVRERCPVTLFLITGIIPLVPGAGIYWTAYYLVTSQLSDALQSGLSSTKISVAIMLGIVLSFELPERLFHKKKTGASSQTEPK